MSLDHVVQMDCGPKLALGGADARRGEIRLLECIYARNRAQLMETLAEQEGKSPREIDITLAGPRGPSKLDYDALMRDAAELLPHEAACANCPANVIQRPFGCQGCLNYAIPLAAEEWMMSQLEEPGTIGASLCLAALKEFGYGGAPVRAWRRQGLLESRRPVEKTYGKKLFGHVVVTSDQVLHALFAVGPVVEPGHAFTVLLWFGAIELDGKVPRTPDDAPLVRALASLTTPDERRARATANIGEPDDDAAVPIERALRAYYTAWQLGVPVGVSP